MQVSIIGRDVVTATLLEVWIDETERRRCFSLETTCHPPRSTPRLRGQCRYTAFRATGSAGFGNHQHRRM